METECSERLTARGDMMIHGDLSGQLMACGEMLAHKDMIDIFLVICTSNISGT
jgi:hypothetical protein